MKELERVGVARPLRGIPSTSLSCRRFPNTKPITATTSPRHHCYFAEVLGESAEASGMRTSYMASSGNTLARRRSTRCHTTEYYANQPATFSTTKGAEHKGSR